MIARKNKTLPKVGKMASNEYTASWILWPNSVELAMSLPRSVDEALSSDYVFYPEVEWVKFGSYPPENLPLIGAWRNRDGTVFAFLLDAVPRKSSKGENYLLLSVIGDQHQVENIGEKIAVLKFGLAETERRDIEARLIDHRIDKEKKSPGIGRLLPPFALITAAVNAFSLFLPKLPTPNLSLPLVQFLYQLLVVGVHFSAIFLLFIVTLICIVYVVRYGYLILRRF